MLPKYRFFRLNDFLCPPLHPPRDGYLRHLKAERAIAKTNKRVIDRLRQSSNPIKLDLGSGPTPGADGWTTVDLTHGCDLRLDISVPLPFGENEVAEIYASHVLEHFHYRDLIRILADWHRVLRPAGPIRVAVPDARIWIKAYTSDDRFDEALSTASTRQRYITIPAVFL